MSRDRIQLRATSGRERRLGTAKDATDLEDDAEVIDAALLHLAESVECYETVKDEINGEPAERLSTDIVRITLYPQVRTD